MTFHALPAMQSLCILLRLYEIIVSGMSHMKQVRRIMRELGETLSHTCDGKLQTPSQVLISLFTVPLALQTSAELSTLNLNNLDSIRS